MFRTLQQIKEVSERTGVPQEYVIKLGIMMSKVKLAQENVKATIENPNSAILNVVAAGAIQNLDEALNYFEKEFLKCKLW